MKKLATTILIGLIITSITPSCIYSNEVKLEISPRKYVKTLKSQIKKDEFEALHRYMDLSSLSTCIKGEIKGVQLAYIEPTIEKIENNQNKVNELIKFIENTTTDNREINSLSKDMLKYLNEMSDCLNKAHIEYTNQLSFELSDDDKINNLSGSDVYFGDENVIYAYDYIDIFNDRVEKVDKIYTHIKDKL